MRVAWGVEVGSCGSGPAPGTWGCGHPLGHCRQGPGAVAISGDTTGRELGLWLLLGLPQTAPSPCRRARCTPHTSHPLVLPRQLSLVSPSPPSGTALAPCPCCHPLQGASCCLSPGQSPGCHVASGKTATLAHPLTPCHCPTGLYLIPVRSGLTCVPSLCGGCCRGDLAALGWVWAGIRLWLQHQVPTGPAAPAEPAGAGGFAHGDTLPSAWGHRDAGMQGQGMVTLVPDPQPTLWITGRPP